MYFVYILYSPKLDKYYIGQTNNLERRLHDHNTGQSKFTKLGIPWDLVYYKSLSSRSEAMALEKKLREMKSREYLLRFIKAG